MSLSNRQKAIIQFKDQYREYLDLKKQGRSNFQANPGQTQKMADLRTLLNQEAPIIRSYLHHVGEPTSIHYSPPPVVGGFSGQYDLLTNLFNPSLIGCSQTTLDMLDRGIGRYNFLIETQWRRRLNPFYWIGELIRSPFLILKFAGFDSEKMELSIFGKLYKAAGGLVTLCVGLIKIYEFIQPIFGRLPAMVKSFIGH